MSTKIKMMKSIISILLLIFTITLSAQERVVTGVVKSFEIYYIQNAQVISKKTKSAVATDSTGRFSIVCGEKDVLSFKANGFFTQKVSLKDKDTLDVNMVFKGEKYAAEVVSNGYMTSENLTHAISHLSEKNNEFSTYTSIYELIIGRFPGVRVNGNSIVIRNSGNLYGNYEALLIVNGSPVTDISTIRPSDVKTIDILKDSSAAIYGVRGAGGVVVIVTK